MPSHPALTLTPRPDLRFTAALGLLLLAVAPVSADSRWRLDLEGGPAWQTRYDFAIAGDTGTRIDLDDDAAVAAFRATVAWDFGERWSLRVLAAPLATATDFVSDVPVEFDGVTFPAGAPLRQSYAFNSYRLSFLYRFASTGPWAFRAGITGKVRDASTGITGAGRSATRDDLGFVPLFNGSADNDDVYSFATFHDALAGVSVRF